MVSLVCAAVLLGSIKPVEYPFKQVEAGGFSQVRDAKVFVIRSTTDYSEYSKACGRDMTPPKMNWAKSQLVAIHIGAAPSTGYGVIVWRIIKTGPRTVDVEVIKTTPPPGRMQAMHITYPWVIVRTPIFTEKMNLSIVPAKAQ